MKLRKNSWYFNLYQFLTGTKPDNNFCDFFWGLVLNVVLLPFTWIMYGISAIFAFFSRDYNYSKVRIKNTFYEQWIKNNNFNLFLKSLIGLMLQTILYIFLFFLITETTKLLLGVLIGIIVLLVAIGVVYFFTESDTKKKIVNIGYEAYDITATGFSSFKNKYCPKIDWN